MNRVGAEEAVVSVIVVEENELRLDKLKLAKFNEENVKGLKDSNDKVTSDEAEGDVPVEAPASKETSSKELKAKAEATEDVADTFNAKGNKPRLAKLVLPKSEEKYTVEAIGLRKEFCLKEAGKSKSVGLNHIAAIWRTKTEKIPDKTT